MSGQACFNPASKKAGLTANKLVDRKLALVFPWNLVGKQLQSLGIPPLEQGYGTGCQALARLLDGYQNCDRVEKHTFS